MVKTPRRHFLKKYVLTFQYLLIYTKRPRVERKWTYFAFGERILDFRWEEALPSVDIWKMEDVLMQIVTENMCMYSGSYDWQVLVGGVEQERLQNMEDLTGIPQLICVNLLKNLLET